MQNNITKKVTRKQKSITSFCYTIHWADKVILSVK